MVRWSIFCLYWFQWFIVLKEGDYVIFIGSKSTDIEKQIILNILEDFHSISFCEITDKNKIFFRINI
jgi:hypothetical protein